MRVFVFFVFAAALILLPKPLLAQSVFTDEAQRIYQAHGGAVYQVQVIDQASGRKAGIGSAFQMTASGHLATNYHVVAEALAKPAANKLEYLHENGTRGAARILAADVVNDLAILSMEKPGPVFVALGTSDLRKGTRLFSLGNPHDIGFTIVEGIYNGPASEGFTDKIHFSGAINPGMSGGPALGYDGRVAGINVMTGGNQIGFLVPVEALKNLSAMISKNAATDDFVLRASALLQEQLVAYQNKNIGSLLESAARWEQQSFGPVRVPGRIHPAFKCWGAAQHRDKDPFTHFFSVCDNQEELYLGDDFETGVIQYRYDLITAKDDLYAARFASYYEDRYLSAAGGYNAGEDHVTNFSCHDDFISTGDLRWKTSFCARRYKRFPDLHDAHLYMALVNAEKQGVIITLSAEGVTRENALSLTGAFLSSVRPQGDAP